MCRPPRARRLGSSSSPPSSTLPTCGRASCRATSSSRGSPTAPCRLALVCAPAGWGKTVLLAQWRAAQAEPTAVRVGLARCRRRRSGAVLELRRRGAADGRAGVRRGGAGRAAERRPGADRGRAAAADQRARGLLEAGRARARRLPPAPATSWCTRRSRSCSATCRGRCSSRSPPAATRRSRSPACAPPASSSRSARSELQFAGAEAERCSTARSRSGSNAGDVELLQQRTEGWPAGLQLAGALAARPQRPRARSSARSRATTARSATTCTR